MNDQSIHIQNPSSNIILMTTALLAPLFVVVLHLK
jgi:hypothetical protein